MTVDERVQQLTDALTQHVAAAWGAALGGEASTSPADASEDTGWSVVLSAEVSGETELTVWFDQPAAGAWVQQFRKLEEAPDEDVIASAVQEVVEQAARALEGMPLARGCTWREGVVGPNQPPSHASWTTLTSATGQTCRIAVSVAVPPADAKPMSAAVSDHRLRAVLDVDLPLIVRFGRAVMPLRAVAELGPGSVIDMARSPDEPVELLIGDRLIARGEVVVVTGNYGVRITELLGDHHVAAQLEASTT